MSIDFLIFDFQLTEKYLLKNNILSNMTLLLLLILLFYFAFSSDGDLERKECFIYV